MEPVCPLLALAGDGRSVIEGVDQTHRCHADDPPQPLDRHQQARVCLTSAHVRCERFLAHAARTGPTGRSRTALGSGLVVTRLTLAPEPAWRGFAGAGPRGRRGSLLAVSAGILVLVIGGGAAGAWALGGLAPGTGLIGDMSATATPSPDPTPSPTSRPTATAATSPSPTATPTPVPTAAATPIATPAPTPTPARTYVVQAGDTLAAIAARFGSTVAAIQAANGIDDPNEILIGQRLVIP